MLIIKGFAIVNKQDGKMMNSAVRLDERGKKVLRAVVYEYTTTASPVGSRRIAKKYKLGLSPATIRNVLSDLEDLGYVSQPYASAGRLPTDKGYRFYVDSLTKFFKLTQRKRMMIEREYPVNPEGIEKLLQQTSRILSTLSHYAGVVLAPNLRGSIFKHLELVSLGEGRILSVLVTGSGMVKNKIIEVARPIFPPELQRVSNLCNNRLSGLSLGKIKDSPLLSLSKEGQNLLKEIFDLDGQEELYLDGAANILDQPEFKDISKTKLIFKALEEKKLLSDIMSNAPENAQGPSVLPERFGNGIRVIIGSESRCRQIEECSLVTATYWISDRPAGNLGVIGPKRMEYNKIISLVDFMAQRVSKILTRISKTHTPRLGSEGVIKFREDPDRGLKKSLPSDGVSNGVDRVKD